MALFNYPLAVGDISPFLSWLQTYQNQQALAANGEEPALEASRAAEFETKKRRQHQPTYARMV